MKTKQIDDLIDRLNQARQENLLPAWELEQLCIEAADLLVELRPYIRSHELMIEMSNGWKCDKSISGYCEYKDDDVCNDSCIYCGQPEERK